MIGGQLSHSGIQPSVSDFFHTTLRDVYVGLLCAIPVFLISCRGYRKDSGEWLSDDLIASVEGLSAFGVAVFPNESPTMAIETVSQEALGIAISPAFDLSSALALFVCLGLFCYA